MMKKIYIGKDPQAQVLGVILADSKDLAQVYFEAKYEGQFSSVEEIDLESDHFKSNDRKYFQLLTSTKCSMVNREHGSGTPRDYIIMDKRGG